MIALTLGDPAGIGPEITLKALLQFPDEPILLIGSAYVLHETSERIGLERPACIRIVDDETHPRLHFGRVQKQYGEQALWALEQGARLLKTGAIRGLVTAPVSKEALRLAGFAYPGQTEFLAARLGARRHAMLAYAPAGAAGSRPLRIVFATIHVPLARVPTLLTPRLVAGKVRLLDEFLRRRERIRHPKIAVLALNPHAYEFTLGEEARIARGIRLAAGVHAEGPFPADTVGVLQGHYDGFVAMYHDQAMIPAKLLAQGRGVNVTIGLPAIRTSPLHGTAFDIAGQGCANPDSMVSAIKLCLRLSGRWRL